MRVAISTDGGYVSAHFGRCPSFTLVDIDGDRVVGREEIDNPGHSPGFIPRFLHERGVGCIVCGGMGSRAAGFFEELRIQMITGVDGKVDDTISMLLGGTLESSGGLCKPGAGKGYGVEKTECDHPHE